MRGSIEGHGEEVEEGEVGKIHSKKFSAGIGLI